MANIIEFGGGPTDEQKRDFYGYKYGTQLPGYIGYIPQLKYNSGKTYGQHTHELALEYDHVRTPNPADPPFVHRLKNEIPEPNGDNKFTKYMVSGYSGDIPRRLFHFGKSYRPECDDCIDEHISDYKKQHAQKEDLRRTVKAFPRLQALNFDPDVRDHLNTYRDTHPLLPVLAETKRGPLEPPIPRYEGFIPRVWTTEAGLGCRYHEMTKNGLAAFRHEVREHFKILQQPIIDVQSCPSSVPDPPKPIPKRMYLQDGMIPKYIGYVPQFKFDFGKTYGDSTRSLEVCYHDEDCYGSYMATKGLQPQQVVS